MTVTINRVSNPSFETGTTGATAVPGTTGVAALTNPVVATPFGTHVLHCQWSTASTAAGGGVYVEIDVAAAGLAVGQTISAGIFRALSSIANRLNFSIEFRTASATISTTTDTATQVAANTQYGATLVGDDTVAWMKLEALVIPATCTKIRLGLYSVAGTGFANWSIGSFLRVDGFLLTVRGTLPRYIDGSLGAGYYWAGTAHASNSSYYVPNVIVTPITTMDPQPRTTIEIDDPYPDATTLSIYQLSSEGQITVRDAELIPAAGGVFKTDFEVPFGVVVNYRAEMFNSAGKSIGLTVQAATQVNIAVGWAIVQDYLEPGVAILVQAEKLFANTLQKSRSLALYPAGLDTIALMGELGLLESVNLRLVTMNDADQADLDDILDAGTVLIRTMPPMPVPRLLFVAIGQPTRVPTDVRWGGHVSIYDIVGDQVSRNMLGILVPTVTWQAVINFFPTWAALAAAHVSWLDLIKNPPPEP